MPIRITILVLILAGALSSSSFNSAVVGVLESNFEIQGVFLWNVERDSDILVALFTPLGL